MRVQVYNNWSKYGKNVFTPCLWYSSDGFDSGIGLDFFGFGICVLW